MAFEKRGENCFEASGIGCKLARVDIVLPVKFRLVDELPVREV
jgi:hypothetical protein